MRLKKLIFDVKDRLNGYEYTYDFVESLRDRCDWGIVDKTSDVYQDVFESKPEVFDLIDLFDSIEDEIEEYEGDEYQAYHNYIAGVVDYYDFLDSKDIVLEQD